MKTDTSPRYKHLINFRWILFRRLQLHCMISLLFDCQEMGFCLFIFIVPKKNIVSSINNLSLETQYKTQTILQETVSDYTAPGICF